MYCSHHILDSQIKRFYTHTLICDRDKKIDLKEKKMRLSGGSMSREAVGGTTGATKTSVVSSSASRGSTYVFITINCLLFDLIG